MASVFFADNFETAYFSMGKWVLSFIGFWPLQPFNKKLLIQIIVNLLVLLTGIVGEIRLAWLIRDNLVETLDAICPCLTKIVTWIKLACLFIYRKQLGVLLNDLFKHLQLDTSVKSKRTMILKTASMTTVWWMVLYFFGISSHMLYSLRPLIKWLYQRYIEGAKNKWVELPYAAALPYKDMTQVNNKVLYSFVYIFMLHTGTVTIYGFPGADGLFMSTCMFISTSYRCLQEDFKKAFKDFKETEENPPANEKLLHKLKILIKRQQIVFNMFETLNNIYRVMIFTHFLFASITLGVVLMNLRLKTGMGKAVNVTYVMGACVQLFTYCYGAEIVNKNFSQLGETLYFCNWYKCDKRVKTLMIFILLKSQKGSRMKVPFFQPSLALLSSILQTSGSYITLIQTFV